MSHSSVVIISDCHHFLPCPSIPSFSWLTHHPFILSSQYFFTHASFLLSSPNHLSSPPLPLPCIFWQSFGLWVQFYSSLEKWLNALALMSSLLTVNPCCLVCVEMCMPVIGSPILLLCFSSPPHPPLFSSVSFSHMIVKESKESDNLLRPLVLDHFCSGTQENKLNSSGSTVCSRNEPLECI